MTSVSEKLKCVYQPEEGEKMSEAKTLHILQRIVSLTAYFDLRSKGVTKGKAGELVAYGCSYNTQTIVRLGNEFVSTQAKRYTTTIGKTVGGRARTKRVSKLIPKEKFIFGKFSMGANRRVRSLMYDENLRAKAKVWLRLNSKSKKGKANLKAEDFLTYLQTDLLESTGW